MVRNAKFLTAAVVGALAVVSISDSHGSAAGRESVTVSASTLSSRDSTPPALMVTNPVSGAKLSGVVNVEGYASDESGISKVELFLNGKRIKQLRKTSQWSVPLDTSLYSDGNHVIETKATDGARNSSTVLTSVSFNNSSAEPSPSQCTGVQVGPTDDLRAVMAAHRSGTTFCLASGTHEIGSESLEPEYGDAIIGALVARGPNGEIDAPTKLRGTAPSGVLRATPGNAVWTVENIDICCSRGGGSAEGRGINGAENVNARLTIRNVRAHGNSRNGISTGTGSLLENVELDHNGDWSLHAGRAGGLKTIRDVTVVGAYIHHNDGNGMWWDCDAPGGEIRDSVVTDNTKAGIWVEISSGLGRGFLIENNIVQRNNLDGDSTRGGILVTSSMNVKIAGNATAHNQVAGIRARNDYRSDRGHNGCSSGFQLSNIHIHDNTLAGDVLLGCSQNGVLCERNKA